jgi:hypothetical protein
MNRNDVGLFLLELGGVAWGIYVDLREVLTLRAELGDIIRKSESNRFCRRLNGVSCDPCNRGICVGRSLFKSLSSAN